MAQIVIVEHNHGTDWYTEDEGETLDWFQGEDHDLVIVVTTTVNGVKQSQTWATWAPGTWICVTRSNKAPDSTEE